MRARYLSRYPWYQFPYYRGRLMQTHCVETGTRLIDDLIDLHRYPGTDDRRLIYRDDPPAHGKRT